MDDIQQLGLEARNDSGKLNRLIEDFLPFIKRCVARSRVDRQSREDGLTLAMLTFADCVMVYEPGKGSFLSFTQVSIRNRLIDDFRGERKRANLSLVNLDEQDPQWETRLSLVNHQRQTELTALRLEIEEMTGLLAAWNTSFGELARLCPKQKRTRARCQYIAELLMKNEAWSRRIFEKRRLPGKDLSDMYGVSVKILEKYRKYIAVLCVILKGDFPMLKTFLPMNRRGGGEDE